MASSFIRSPRKALLIVGVIIVTVISATLLTIFVQVQSLRLLSRTVSDRQFIEGAEWWQHDLGDIRAFEATYGLDPEKRGGLRMAIAEWPNWRYLISVDVLDDGTARGALRAWGYGDAEPAFERSFQLDETERNLFFRSFDEEIDGYWGSTVVCLDGTGVQFERWKDSSLSSGQGNAACHRHYAELMSLVAEALVIHFKDVPFDWRSWLSRKRLLDLRENES